jgi:predicted kinase
MNKKIIIISGYIASGKSTFALQLSKETGVPYLMKDTLKTTLCASVALRNQADSKKFSAVTFDAMMYVVERMMEVGQPIIIEGNFVPQGLKKTDEAGVIKNLIKKYDYKSLTFKFIGDTSVLYDRCIERDKLPERGANKMFNVVSYEEFDVYCHNLDDFDIGGKTITVDTTDFNLVDYPGYIKVTLDFLKIMLQ